MFICQSCNQNQEGYVRPIKVATEIRATRQMSFDIAKEINCCVSCACLLTGATPESISQTPSPIHATNQKILPARIDEVIYTPRPETSS